ncbi:MAG: phage tail spike protein, partial [Dialister micraerophilus]
MLYLFNNNEKLIRIVRKNAIRSLTQKQELKDSYVSDQLFSEIKPIDDTLLQEVEYLAIPSQEDHNKYHFYWLKDFNLDGDILSLTGVQSGIEELSKLPIYDQKPRELEASYVIDRLLDGTNWSRGYTAPTAKRNANFYYISVFDALKKLCQVWGLEMQFFVEITNHKLGNRFIEFKQKIGDNNGARVVYGHNALKVIKETNRSGLYTALIGRGKGEQVSTAGEVNSQGNITEADGYGRKINFADVTWSKSKGDPVDKPQGQQFVENREATALYGTPGINGATLPKIGFVDFQDEEDPEQLLRLTWQKLQEVDHPQVTFKTSTVYLDGKIGDTVRVVRPDKKIDYTTRIFRISWDRLTDTSTEVILGDKLLESQTTRTQRIVNLTTNHLSDSFMDQINNLSHAIMQASADRFSRNFYSRVDPREVTDQYGNAIVPRVDDTWYQPHPDHEGYTIIHIWDGEQWVIAMDTWSIKDEINQRIDEAVAEAEKIKE